MTAVCVIEAFSTTCAVYTEDCVAYKLLQAAKAMRPVMRGQFYSCTQEK